MGEDLSESFKLSPTWFKTLVCKSNPALCKVLPKTPYQLDLEVKDRKPSIIPKVGDKVKIKSQEWYEKWKDKDEDIRFPSRPNYFAKGMAKYCGLLVTINKNINNRFLIDESDIDWVWLPEFFEEVYPVQEQLSSKFPSIDLNSPYLYQSPYEVKGSELVLSKEEQERLKQQLREKWGVKPKLKQVKTTHLLRFKKL